MRQVVRPSCSIRIVCAKFRARAVSLPLYFAVSLPLYFRRDGVMYD